MGKIKFLKLFPIEIATEVSHPKQLINYKIMIKKALLIIMAVVVFLYAIMLEPELSGTELIKYNRILGSYIVVTGLIVIIIAIKKK